MKNIWQWIVKPPYHGMPWVLWIYVISAYVIMPNGGVFTGHLIGWDDHTRMTQVLNWVNGAGWYDRTITRVNAPEGFTTIWARIVDIPLATIVWICQHFTAQKTAALIAVAIIPMITLIMVFKAAAYFVRPLTGKNKANLISLFLLFTSVANPALESFSNAGFYMGQASHHSWYIVLVLTLFGATARLAIGSISQSARAMLAMSVTMLLAVGIEGFPMIATAVVLLAMVAWANNQPNIAHRASQAFTCSTIGALLLLPMHQPPAHWLKISFAEPSIIGPLLSGLAAIFLHLQKRILRALPRYRLEAAIITLCLAIIMAIGFGTAIPQILNGASAALSPAERRMALHEHLEALSVYKVAATPFHLFSLMFPSLIALTGGIYSCLKARTTRRRTISLCYMGFAAIGFTMEMMFSRYCHHALTTGCAWILWVWEEIKKLLRNKAYYNLLAITSYFILAPFSMFALIIIGTKTPFTSNLLLFPSLGQNAVDPCDPLSLSDYINKHYPSSTNLIVPYWLSSEFLYYSDVKIDFLANYPSQDKFIDSYAFWRATNPFEARTIAQSHKVDLVAACTYPSFYITNIPATNQAFLPQLQVGSPIDWLRPVPLDIPTNFVLYEVDH